MVLLLGTYCPRIGMAVRAKAMPSAVPDLNKNPFFYIGGDRIKIESGNELAKTSTSWYNFVKMFGLVGFTASLLICAIAFLFVRSPERKKELKERFMAKALILIGLFAFVFLFGQLYAISRKLV